MEKSQQLLILVCIFLLKIFSSGAAELEHCPPDGHHMLPHPDCTKYVVCDYGVEYIYECEANLYFDPLTMHCLPAAQVPECQSGTRPTVPTTTTPTTTTKATTTTPTTTTEDPIKILTKCGDTVKSKLGRIEYKPGQQYDADEMCSFVVRTPYYTGIVFNLESHGIDAQDSNAIAIYSYDRSGLLDAIHLGPPNPTQSAYVMGGIAVVMFKPRSTNGTGFVLSWEGVSEQWYAVRGEGLVYSNGTQGEIEVPFWVNFTDSTSVIVINHNNRVIPSDQMLALKMTEEYFGNSPSCYDYIMVYTLTGDMVKLEETFCDEFQHRSTFHTNGVFILMFYKWADNRSAKATLSWKLEDL